MTDEKRFSPGEGARSQPGQGLPQDRERDLQLWSAQKWSAVTPPMRPSPQELAVYEKNLLWVNLADGATALILGATPELRSLALKHGLRTTGCDFDANFWQAMTLLRTVEGPEEFLHADWLDLPEDRRYDAILGDCSLNMLTPERVAPFVQKIHGLLHKDGISIQRIQTANENLNMDDIAQAVRSFRENNPGISLNLYLIFLAQSLRNLYHPEMTHRQFYESIVFRYLTPEEIEGLRPFLIDRKMAYPRPQDMTDLLEQFFKIVRVEKSSGPGLWDTAAVYVLKNK
ncbi:MAG: class I SAM-dependent methyltransferase [Candidatus Aminicenantes bacterium]|nr:class I SAM-dependent methyltransferase [Candidatus Aminicenantes bacterium]